MRDQFSLGVGLFVLGDVGFGHVDNLLLLTAGKPRGGLKNLSKLAARRGALPRTRQAENLLDGDAEGCGQRRNKLGLGDTSGAFPRRNVGVVSADLLGQLAHGQPGAFAQFAERGWMGIFRHGVILHHDGQKNLQMDRKHSTLEK